MSVPKVVCRRADEQTQWGLGAPLLVAGELYLRRERKYVAVPALLLVLALTRPIALAFIPVMTAHGVGRWRERIASPFSRKDHRAVVFLAAFCIATTGLWLVIVGSSTRDIFAWTRTHEAWRTELHLAPRMGWPACLLFNYGWLALAMLALIVLLTLGIALRPGGKAWRPELRCRSVTYPGCLQHATVPGPSVIRWALWAFPLMWPFQESAATRSGRRCRVILTAVLAIVGLARQWVWISSFSAAPAPSERFP